MIFKKERKKKKISGLPFYKCLYIMNPNLVLPLTVIVLGIFTYSDVYC